MELIGELGAIPPVRAVSYQGRERRRARLDRGWNCGGCEPEARTSCPKLQQVNQRVILYPEKTKP
jgi:hypothetical protein